MEISLDEAFSGLMDGLLRACDREALEAECVTIAFS
jgi:hypothetical protein